MNYLYLNNPPIQQPIQRTFVFNKRNEKIDWRRIAAVDVDRVARELDFQVLQDNIEQIALCNIDLEVDSRAMDPNFLKLYKMAQLTIEYLLLCQDQITSQLVDYEQIKGKSFLDQDEARRQIEKLKNDLNETKKESKKRKKLIETQQKMLMAQQTTHHNCPICSHSFLSVDYLQAHIHRRHPEYDPDRRREHDVDKEKELQRLKNDLQSKETELQSIKIQKTADEGKIRERDEKIHQLEDKIQSLEDKIRSLDEKYFSLRSSTQNQTPSPHRREAGVKELLKENKSLRAENEQLRQSSQQAESNLKKEQKIKRRLERDIQKLQSEINTLNETLHSLQNISGDTSRLSEELIAYRNRYNEEKNRRKKLQDELDEANNQLAQFRNQPPPVIDRKSPAPPPRATASPSPPPPPSVPIPIRPTHTTEILLPQYCPSLVRRINENPRYLNSFQTIAKQEFIDEFEQYENLDVKEKDTRLSTNDFPTKMNIIEQTRRNMQRDLPNFERIRADLSGALDKLATERISGQHASGTSVPSASGRSVTFEDKSKHQDTVSPKRPTTAITTVQPKTKYDYHRSSIVSVSDEEPKHANTNRSGDNKYSQPTRSGVIPSYNHPATNFASDDEQTNTNTSESEDNRHPQPTRPGVVPSHNRASTNFPSDQTQTHRRGSADDKHPRPKTPAVIPEIYPSPRKQIPTTGVSALASGSMRPSIVNNTKTVSAIVRPQTAIQKYESESDSDSPDASNVAAKTQVLNQKLNDINSSGRKPTTNAVPQGFQPSRQTPATQNDDDSDSPLTSIEDDVPPGKTPIKYPSHIARDTAHTNPHLSSGDVSQYTYDSLMKSPVGKAPDFRRPATADSAKTSNVDSDDNFEEDESN